MLACRAAGTNDHDLVMENSRCSYFQSQGVSLAMLPRKAQGEDPLERLPGSGGRWRSLHSVAQSCVSASVAAWCSAGCLHLHLPS